MKYKKQIISVTLDPNLISKIDDQGKQTDRTRSNIINHILKNQMGGLKKVK
jgi:metal-responsive CopG/Arc/MetJ family transcriptional regulator